MECVHVCVTGSPCCTVEKKIVMRMRFPHVFADTRASSAPALAWGRAGPGSPTVWASGPTGVSAAEEPSKGWVRCEGEQDDGGDRAGNKVVPPAGPTGGEAAPGLAAGQQDGLSGLRANLRPCPCTLTNLYGTAPSPPDDSNVSPGRRQGPLLKEPAGRVSAPAAPVGLVRSGTEGAATGSAWSAARGPVPEPPPTGTVLIRGVPGQPAARCPWLRALRRLGQAWRAGAVFLRSRRRWAGLLPRCPQKHHPPRRPWKTGSRDCTFCGAGHPSSRHTESSRQRARWPRAPHPWPHQTPPETPPVALVPCAQLTSLQQCQILKPLREARDRTCILMDTVSGSQPAEQQ